MKVAIYARVSLEETNEKDRRYQEPENQLEPLREWAKNQKWEVIEEFVDRGSGADPNRPRFRQMLQDAMMLKFQTILVWKLDRFSREPMSVTMGRIQRLRERSIGVKSLTETWLDTAKDNPMGDLVMAIMAWAAGEERRKISDRTKLGIARRRSLGTWKGGRPKILADSETKIKILEMNKQGKGTTTIMRKTGIGKKTIKELIEKGLPPNRLIDDGGKKGSF